MLKYNIFYSGRNKLTFLDDVYNFIYTHIRISAYIIFFLAKY